MLLVYGTVMAVFRGTKCVLLNVLNIVQFSYIVYTCMQLLLVSCVL